MPLSPESRRDQGRSGGRRTSSSPAAADGWAWDTSVLLEARSGLARVTLSSGARSELSNPSDPSDLWTVDSPYGVVVPQTLRHFEGWPPGPGAAPATRSD